MSPEGLSHTPDEAIASNPEQQETKTYYLDGKVKSVWHYGDRADVTLTPYQGSPDLLRSTAIDASSVGEYTVTVSGDEAEGKDEGDVIQISGITIEDGRMITQRAKKGPETATEEIPKAA